MKKVALVTGGSRGIGFGIAKELARSGYNLAINGRRSEEDVQEALAELSGFGAEVLYCRADVSSPEDHERVVEAIEARFGQLNLLVNNAGVAPLERNDILVATPESYDRVMNINLKGPYFLTQKIANWMIDQKNIDPNFQGCIVNVGSISATVVSTNRGEYCLSKAAMGMMTQLFAVRLGEFGIPVYEIRPGVVSTDMTAGVKEKYDKLIKEGLMVQPRWGQPEDNGKVVVAMAEGYLPYSTGQVVMVDGGLTIPRL